MQTQRLHSDDRLRPDRSEFSMRGRRRRFTPAGGSTMVRLLVSGSDRWQEPPWRLQAMAVGVMLLIVALIPLVWR